MCTAQLSEKSLDYMSLDKRENPPASNDPVSSDASALEDEFGVPFAGVILPPEQWVQTALKRLPEQGKLDYEQLFGRSAPRVLDIGCGNGRFLLSSAVRRPDFDHIGIDALPMVIRYATRRCNQRGLSNCRVAVCDGERFLKNYSPPGQLNEIHIYHPQPYHDPADQSQRLFSHDFLWLLHQALAPEGLLVVQTDNSAYWKYLNTVIPIVFEWHEHPDVWPEDPQGRTRREIVALHKGLKIYRGWGVRRSDIDQETFERLIAGQPQPNFRSDHNRNPRRWRRPKR